MGVFLYMLSEFVCVFMAVGFEDCGPFDGDPSGS